MILTRADLGEELARWQELFNSKWKLSQNGECWIWQASIRSDAYGQFHIKRRPLAAHRAAYLLFKGDLQFSLQVCHTCDVPRCVNPEHLYLATPQENSADMVAKGRSQVGEEHHQAKLTEEAVLAIRASSVGSEHIARRYGVDGSLIRRIRRNEIWRHI